MSGAYWLATVSILYAIIASINIFWLRFCPVEAIQLGYMLILALPLVIPTIGRWCNMKSPWGN